jgi:monofunctional biosynthetic peptidoglycan transglycosylase
MRRALRIVGRVFLVMVLLVVAVQAYFFAACGWYRWHNPGMTGFMRESLEAAQQTEPNVRFQQTYVPLTRISENLRAAVITSEDARFVEHEGVDWDAIEKAYENNKRRGKKIKGGSTITQQLAKNLFLSGERSYLRKGQELIITYMLEFWMDKARILELYLNVVEWGNGVFGAEAAAEHYYGIPASKLSVDQSARLAAMLPNPRHFDRDRGSAYLADRAAHIAHWMPDADLP